MEGNCTSKGNLENNANPCKTKRNRASWKPISVVKTFLEACLHELAFDGREGSGLKVLSWKRVAKVLKDNHNFEVDQKQMKNHYDYLKTKYTAWLSLRNKTGNIYDESTNTFNLSEEEWKLEILKNKNVESLKTTSLPFPELCAPLFDGTLSTGFKSVGPSSTEPRRVVEAHVPGDDEETEVVNVDSPTPLCSSRDPRPPVKTKKRGKQLMDGIEEEILGVLKVIANKINQPTSESPPKPEPPSVEDCENKLNGLEWDENDPLYETALAIFCDPNDHYREGWMKLKPDRCVNWVKMIGRAKGFM